MRLRRRAKAPIAWDRFRGVVPLALMTTLIVAVGAYTAVQQAAFLTSYNLRNLLLATMPLALVSIGQTSALLVGGFDVSVGALLTICVVVASYTMTPETSTWGLIPGALALVGVGLRRRSLQRTLVRVLRLPSIIATLATFSILQGISLWMRDHPAGSITATRSTRCRRVGASCRSRSSGSSRSRLAGDFWLYRTRSGMALRAVGLDETSSRRIGIRANWVVIAALVACSVLASIGGFYLAAEVQIGNPIIGNQALESIAAGVLGGASLAGGRGSFFGTMLAALFLTEIDNVLPLFHQPTEYAEMTIGVLILAALVLYQGPELLRRFRSTRQRVGRLRSAG